jgi:outer membrane protein TolC
MKNASLFGLLLVFGTFRAHAAPLSLQGYLDQVKSQSPAVQSSTNLIEGSKSTSMESDLLFMPRFFLNATYTYDRRQFPNAFFGGRTNSDNFNLGFEKQFDFGLAAKLSYTLFNNNTTNLPAIIFPNGVNAYTSGQTQLDLNQSLWRNFFGKETRATETVAEASSLAAHYGESFKLKQTLAQAENAYFRLAIANESVTLEKELLDRAKRILDWTTRRVANHLTDRIDMLQSKASFQARAISLQTALEEQRAARLSFNQFRNLEQDVVGEEITLAGTDMIQNLKAPKRAPVSDDIKAAEQNERLVRANNELALQKAQPDLNVFATAAFNGVDRYLSPALANSLSTQNPYYVLGLKFSMPLYFLETAEIRGGRVKQQLAAESATRQKTLESTQAFQDLEQRLGEAQARLKMADELVTLQKEKLEYEKYRFNLGRTTTYQVLTFEQDYAQALIARLRVEREILATHSQLKTYTE